MSFDLAARDTLTNLDFTDLVDAPVAAGLSPTAKGRRARKRAVKQRLAQASMLAPLLATEGCLTLGGKASPDALDDTPGGAVGGGSSGGGGGGAAPSAVVASDDSHFMTDIGKEIHISANDLLANDAFPVGATGQVVRVFGAVNGTVTLENGVVHFTPTPGFEGFAYFQYEVRDSLGNLSQATVEIGVGEHDHTGHDHGGGGGGMDHGNGGTPHADDPSKAMEHMAVLNLVPIEGATHTAVNSGSWFDPNTWDNGQVPGAGAKVVIPEGVEVIYDGESAVSLFTVRVDGALEFATDRDTFMEVDTFVVTPSGRLTIGSIDNPVDANVKAVIQIADNGPIDVNWDPMLLSRGVISHGEFEVHGAEKASFLRVATDPRAGDVSITLEAPPEGWQVGDKLVLTGTHLTASPAVPAGVARDDHTEDEELIITRIEGNTIFFATPLQ